MLTFLARLLLCLDTEGRDGSAYMSAFDHVL